jgi:hypothetical protein
MNPQLEKQMQVVKTALGANDPAVAAMAAIGEILGSMQEEIQGLREKIQSIEAAGVTLRITRLWNFPLILIAGIVLGLAVRNQVAHIREQRPPPISNLRREYRRARLGHG